MLTLWILGCALRGPVPHEVDLADLAPLAPAGLQALQDEEHALSVARTLHAGAEEEEKRAADRVEEARNRRKQEKLEFDVASANLDAAEESGDASRRGLAKGYLEEARRQREAAEAAERWQELSLDAARQETRLAEARVTLREAELEMARFELVATAEQGRGYMRSDFTEQLRDAQQRYDEAQRAYDEASERALRAYDQWKQLDLGTQG